MSISAHDQNGLRTYFSSHRRSFPGVVSSPEGSIKAVREFFMEADIKQMPDVLAASLNRFEDRVHNAKLDAKVASGDLFPKYAERRKKPVPPI